MPNKPYPQTLTTSDWVDYLVGLSRDEQIAALATFHRRIEQGAKSAALSELIDPDPDASDAVTVAAKQAHAAVPKAEDYEPS